MDLLILTHSKVYFTSCLLCLYLPLGQLFWFRHWGFSLSSRNQSLIPRLHQPCLHISSPLIVIGVIEWSKFWSRFSHDDKNKVFVLGTSQQMCVQSTDNNDNKCLLFLKPPIAINKETTNLMPSCKSRG